MKLKLAIVYGILSWICIYILSLILKPYYIEGIPYMNSLVPVSIIIVTTFFGILYIREFNKHEVKEGFLLGITFFFIDLIFDKIYSIFFGPSITITDNPLHVLSMLILLPLITTFLGYLAQMNIELN